MNTTTDTAVATATAGARSFAEQTLGEQGFSLFVFGLGAALSGAMLYYLITNPARLSDAWTWTRSLPLALQALIWVLFLPWMICLWMWTLPLAVPIRFVLVIAALAWTNWLLWPWK